MTDPRITPELIEAARREMYTHEQIDSGDHRWVMCSCGETFKATDEGWLAFYDHSVRAALEAAFALLPEPEWEWSGESVAFPGTSLMQVYAVRGNAEHDMQPGYRLVRRIKAGPWHPVPDTNEEPEPRDITLDPIAQQHNLTVSRSRGAGRPGF